MVLNLFYDTLDILLLSGDKWIILISECNNIQETQDSNKSELQLEKPSPYIVLL